VKEIDAQWQGGLNLTYYTGPAGLAHLFVDNKFEVKPIWNVIAKIPGELEPDKEVILGNHRDAWVFGAVDPNAGTSVMMEVSRGLGLLYKMGIFRFLKLSTLMTKA
jgi:N-acetylated-alpha-linked acidic dipeptidase